MSNDPVHHKPLSENLKRQGFLYKQVKREGAWAIYEQFRKSTEKSPEKSIGFELVKIGKHNGFTIAGIDIPPAETYPSSSMWGMVGWTYNTIEDAAESLTKKRIEYGEIEEEVKDSVILEEMYTEESSTNTPEENDESLA